MTRGESKLPPVAREGKSLEGMTLGNEVLAKIAQCSNLMVRAMRVKSY